MEEHSLNDAFDFKWNPNIFVVACVSPVIDYTESGFEEKLEKIDEKSLLETKNTLFSPLDVTYRNSYQIQSFYNVFLAHYNQFAEYYENDILTGIMQQPQMNPNASSSSQDGMGSNLPSGPKPTLFITNKHLRELSNDELSIVGTHIFSQPAATMQTQSVEQMVQSELNEEIPNRQAKLLIFSDTEWAGAFQSSNIDFTEIAGQNNEDVLFECNSKVRLSNFYFELRIIFLKPFICWCKVLYADKHILCYFFCLCHS